MADGPSIGTAYLRVAGDFSHLNTQAVGLFKSPKWSKLGKVAGAGLAAGFAAGSVAKAIYDVGEEFDSAYDKIRVGTGKTGKALGKLKGDFKAVVSSVPADFDETAEAVAGLNTRLGLTGKPLRKLSKEMLELSRITGSDLGGNIQSTTRLFGDWSVATKDQPKTLDKLFRASQQTGIGISELSDYMVQFGSPLRQMGFDFDTAATMFSKFEKEGVNLQTAMPGLRMALKNFAKEGKDPATALDETIDKIKGLSSTAEANTMAFEIFGTRAGPDLAAAIREGRFDFDKLQASIAGGHDTVMKAGKATEDTAEKMQLLGNKLKVLIAPAAEAVFKGVGRLAGALAEVNFKKLLNEAKPTFKAISEAVSDAAKVIGPILGAALKTALQAFKGFAQAIKGISQIISGVLRGDFGKAWQGVKNLFSGGVKFALAAVKGLTTPLRAIVGGIGDAMGDGFSKAWTAITGTFESGANSVIDLLNAMIEIINKVPFIDIGTVGHLGGKSFKERAGNINTAPGQGAGGLGKPNHRYTGGPITRPTAIVGEEAPQHHEWVIATNPKYRKDNVGYWMQAGRDLGIPGFLSGGDISGAVGGAASAVGGAAAGIAKGAFNSAAGVLGALPNPGDYLPGWMDGSYFIDAAKDWLADRFKSQAKKVAATAGGVGGYTGPPANMAQLGDNAYVDSHTLAVTAFLDKQFGLTMSSGYRSPAHNAAIGGAPGSLHTHGSEGNPGATDSVGSMGAMQAYIAYAKQHVAGLKEAMVDNYAGLGYNAHLGFFAGGGPMAGFKNRLAGTTMLSAAAGQPSASGTLVGASYYGGPTDGVSGTVGAAGVSLPGKMSFAELAMGHALGGLPFHTKLKIGYNGKSVVAEKLDIGLGGDDVNGHNRAIDLWYETANAIGMPGTAVVKVSPASGAAAGGDGLTKGQETRAQAKARKKQRESQLSKLRQSVAGSKTTPAKQSSLWKLLKFWGRAGIFDKGEKSHILDVVQRASAAMNPEGRVKILSGLASYAHSHGEITGRDPENWHDMTDAIEKAQERGTKERERVVEKHKRQRERKKARIEGRGEFAGLAEMLLGKEGAYNRANQDAERLVALEPEELGDDYVGQERGAWGGVLQRLAEWRDSTVIARNTAGLKMETFQGQIDRVKSLKGEAFQKNKWRIPALRQAIANAKEFISGRRSDMETFQGYGGPQTVLGGLGEGTPWWLTLGGPGASIFDTQNTIRELGVKVGGGSGGDSESGGAREGILEDLLRQSNQRNIVSEVLNRTRTDFGKAYPYLGAFAQGGVALVGEKGPELAHMPAGTRIHSAQDTAQMLEPKVIVNGDIVQAPGDIRDPVEIVLGDRRFAPAVQKATLGARPLGRPTPTGARR